MYYILEKYEIYQQKKAIELNPVVSDQQTDMLYGTNDLKDLLTNLNKKKIASLNQRILKKNNNNYETLCLEILLAIKYTI